MLLDSFVSQSYPPLVSVEFSSSPWRWLLETVKQFCTKSLTAGRRWRTRWRR